jgi:hypothetical protein
MQGPAIENRGVTTPQICIDIAMSIELNLCVEAVEKANVTLQGHTKPVSPFDFVSAIYAARPVATEKVMATYPDLPLHEQMTIGAKVCREICYQAVARTMTPIPTGFAGPRKFCQAITNIGPTRTYTEEDTDFI